MKNKLLILILILPVTAWAQGPNVMVVNPSTMPVPVTGTITASTTAVGAAHYANGQVTTSGSAATLLAARATRRSVTFVNTDTSITVYIGLATVTSANGLPLKAGQSISIDTNQLIQGIAASGSPVVAYMETYD